MCWEHRNREGIIFYDVYYTSPDGTQRKVLAQAGLAQVHVPYDDNSSRYHDISDYGLGGSYLDDLDSSDCVDALLMPPQRQKLLIPSIKPRPFYRCLMQIMNVEFYRFQAAGVCVNLN